MSDIKLPDVESAMKESLQLAAKWLKTRMMMLVGVQCPVGGPNAGRAKVKDGRHSAPGEPPRKESGVGQASIDWMETDDGAAVGVRDIGTTNMVGGNYMAGWDVDGDFGGAYGIRGVRRPWLSMWAQLYKPEMERIIRRHMKTRLGA